MNNFFSNNTTPLASQYDNLKNNYEKIFIEAAESIRREVNAFKPENPCEKCSVKECKIEKKDVFTPFPPICAYRDWQLQILTFLAGDYRQKLKAVYKNMMDKKNEYTCNKCAACCKLATSEYSYEQLKQRASRGDKFSRDFVSVFVPYETEEDAKNANPEFFKLINDIIRDEKVYYYIRKNFPHNPLKLIPSTCAFNAWKEEISHDAMLLKAKVDIIDFYKGKLQ